MLRIAKGLLTIIAVATIAVGATGAYFSDSKTVSGNTFTAGTLALTVGTPSSAVWTMPTMAPGQSTGVQTLTVTNTGSLKGHLSLNIAFLPADSVPNAVDVTDQDVAKNMIVDSATWVDNSNVAPGLNLIGSLVTDSNSNGWIDLDDLQTAVNGVGTIATLVSSESGSLAMNIRFNPSVGNNFQSDGIQMTLTGTLTSY
ncbi:MAG: TasA family protein [Candidatus Berkelbacteria bacterium]